MVEEMEKKNNTKILNWFHVLNMLKTFLITKRFMAVFWPA